MPNLHRIIVAAAVLFEIFPATAAKATSKPSCEDNFASLTRSSQPESGPALILDSAITHAMNVAIPRIEDQAYRELERTPGTAGLIRFNEVIDEAVRAQPEYAASLLRLATNRLPYLKNQPTVVFVSGGVSDPWTPVLKRAAKAQGLDIKIVKLPGSLSFARGANQAQVPAFPPELQALLKKLPAIFLDDTYTNGGTAKAVREAVQKAGGKLDGVFVVYEGGKGDPSSLYKTGRNNRREPSMGNFPDHPEDWSWANGIPKKVAIELNDTLVNSGSPDRLTAQGKAFLSQLEKMGAQVQILENGKPIAPPSTLKRQFSGLTFLEKNANADLAVGNWGREFRGSPRSDTKPAIPTAETLRIGTHRGEGILSQDLLDPNYFMNRLSELGVMEPRYPSRQGTANTPVDSTFHAELDLRNVAPPRAENGSHDFAAIARMEEPKERVARISRIRWEELTDAEQAKMIELAPLLTNSFEIGAYVKVAQSSTDSRWEPVLQGWLDEWKDVQRGWQTFVRPEVEKALRGIQKIPAARSKIDFAIPPAQIEQARKQLNRALLDETHFIIPSNDGEAVRALDILRAAGAPHFDATKMPWGAKLDEIYQNPAKIRSEIIDPLKRKGVKRVVIFELPAPELEKVLQENGFEVSIIDHHNYPGLKREKPESALEQLAQMINWPMSRTDEAIAINDRGYIPGLREMGLTDDEIRAIRKNDYAGQGKAPALIEAQVRKAQEFIPQLKVRNGVTILDLPPEVDEAILREELAIAAGDKILNAIELRPTKIGFSGENRIADALFNDIDFQALGYAPDDVVKYTVGGSSGSKLFGFKPKNPPQGHQELVPEHVRQAFWKAIDDTRDAMPLNPAKGEIHYQLHGKGNPETIVLIHGLDSATFTFDSIVEKLAKKYQVLVYDQRGHGKSVARGTNYSTEVLAGDLKALLDHLDLKQVHVLGHSLGGRTAASFVQQFPERVRSVMIEDMELVRRAIATPEKDQQYRTAAIALKSRFANKEFPSRAALIEALAPIYGREAESLTYRRARENPDGTMTLLFNPDVSFLYGYQANTEDLTDSLRKAGKPVLFVTADPRKGGAMTEKGMAQAAASAPGAQVIAIPGAGHVIHRTHTDDFLGLIEDFVDHGRVSAALVSRHTRQARAPGSIDLDALSRIEDPKQRVAELSRIEAEELLPAQMKAMADAAPRLTNSFEMGQYIRLAEQSKDPVWIPALDRWIQQWDGSSIGWQGFMRQSALKAKEAILDGPRQVNESKAAPQRP